MATLNKLMVIGRCGGDPESRTLSNGSQVVNFSLAISEKNTKTGEYDTTWLKCEVWGKAANNASMLIKKGSDVYVEGKLKITLQKLQGENKYWTSCMVFNFQLLGKKEDDRHGLDPRFDQEQDIF